MNEAKASAGGSIGVGGLLTVAFVVMKLASIGAVARWSWWWVLSPTWIPLAIVCACLLLFMLAVSITALLEMIFR